MVCKESCWLSFELLLLKNVGKIMEVKVMKVDMTWK